MLEGSAKDLADAALMVLANESEHPSVERVSSVLSAFRLAVVVDELQFAAAERHVHARLILSMGKGVAVAPKFESWLRHRKATIDKYYWERYRQYLMQQGWGPAVVRRTDETVDELLDYAGDPLQKGPWKRRGLVVGNVQSGKTATYTALCNKAADAGYKLIILLAGTLNSLRHQTQERLDEGFIGFDTAEIGTSKILKASAAIGVGRFDNQRAPHAFTSKTSDFNASKLSIRTRLDGLSAPVLMVVKKNKRILENLYSWLVSQNPGVDDKIDVPLLLIDDEADAASVNTGSEENPRAINAAIRALLTRFTRSSYVGFTATPFANIFIAPDSVHAMLEDDLYPEDYIYSLEPPSNYVGPVRMFENDEERFLVLFDDADAIFPKRHKKELVVDQLPESLFDALRSFLIVNAIRDLRGHGSAHRSMLVNVSWANNVQDQVAVLLKDELEALIRDAQTYAAYEPDHALARSGRLRSLKAIWEREHRDAGFSWSQIQAVLFEAIRAIDVRAINMTSGTSRLDYDANKARGLRVIAVGGNALSRGLTLEGLSTSYIFRNSQAYDTLLQMGRWFGYRPEFDDLCRVWMTEESVSWYSHITRATEELRAELRRMHDLKLTPRQFGLKVRAHPEALIVTARAKMRTSARVAEGPVTLSLQHPEGTQLPLNDDAHRSNLEAADAFLRKVIDSGATADEYAAQKVRYLWQNVPKMQVAVFLANLQVHAASFQPIQIARFLHETDISELQLWDVAIPSGRSKERIDFAGIEISPVIRRLNINPDSGGYLEVYKRRLGSAEDESIGLNEAQLISANAAIAARKRESILPLLAGRAYRSARSRPLLLLYFIEPSPESHAGKAIPSTRPIVTVGLSLPNYDDEDASRQVMYQTNVVWQQMHLALQSETDEDELLEDALDA
jgi:hypothetical protein